MAKHAGSCACGAVKYEFDGEPVGKALCHCRSCQHRSGSAYTTNLLVPRGKFRFTSSKASIKNWTFTQQPSGLDFTTSFCGDCGTLIYKQNDDEAFAGIFIVSASTTEDGVNCGGMPQTELWIGSRAAWVGETAGAEQVQGFA